MRIELSDPSRLNELREFFVRVRASPCIADGAVIVTLPGRATAADSRHVRAYLNTWLELEAAAGKPIVVTVIEE